MNPSTALARVLVDELVGNGVRDVVLSPGSRNAPLSMALHRADAAGRLRLHVRIDERTAGFLALGLSRGEGRPAAVVTTSGTAVANLHPAVLEAHHDGIALLVLTADRPPWLQDVGANQTIDQRTVFGPALRLFHEFEAPTGGPRNASWRSMVCRAVAAASGSGSASPGPVQLNVPLADPLLPDSSDMHADELPETLAGRGGPWTRIVVDADTASVPPPGDGERVLFLADLTHPWAAGVAAAGHLVISEAGGAAGGSVLASGVHLIGCRDFLNGARPHRVIVLGRPTLFRAVTALLADHRIAVDVVAPAGGFADPGGHARSVAPALPDIRNLPDRRGRRAGGTRMRPPGSLSERYCGTSTSAIHPAWQRISSRLSLPARCWCSARHRYRGTLAWRRLREMGCASSRIEASPASTARFRRRSASRCPTRSAHQPSR